VGKVVGGVDIDAEGHHVPQLHVALHAQSGFASSNLPFFQSANSLQFSILINASYIRQQSGGTLLDEIDGLSNVLGK